ncbi:hypothetical protein E1A91_A05G221000v1 [Gossypium mustelinum]|uniref:Uncharacterized protein n=2 Tax=Gossypium TaxID=3633 RepID=A0A5D2ZAK3_GOSMU|nr:hypothetical protein ES332_A05G224000v1 [Gossypium tomentosum]TYJ35213.1 hypothetical protein E1A91_A05G221000v1 [Gossypium mustelinum]
MKRILCVLGLLALLVSVQLDGVHGRALRSKMTDDNVVVPSLEGEAVGVPSSAVSTNDSRSSRKSLKSMAFTLASGPSRKGPGH